VGGGGGGGGSWGGGLTGGGRRAGRAPGGAGAGRGGSRAGRAPGGAGAGRRLVLILDDAARAGSLMRQALEIFQRIGAQGPELLAELDTLASSVNSAGAPAGAT
jgi:hypothetical protein